MNRPGTFQPGNKGGGRKRRDPAFTEWLKPAAVKARERIEQIAADTDHPDCFKANALILAYAEGKPQETVKHDVAGAVKIEIAWQDSWVVGDARTSALASSN